MNMESDAEKPPQRAHLRFRKSSYSPNDITCVGVCFEGGNVLVTNTARRDAPIVEFTQDEWRAFILGAKDGEFDIHG